MVPPTPIRKSTSGRKQWTLRGNKLFYISIAFSLIFHYKQLPVALKHLQFIFTNIFHVLDGQRSSLNPLIRQIAREGCPESQVVLAKQLLEEKCGTYI